MYSSLLKSSRVYIKGKCIHFSWDPWKSFWLTTEYKDGFLVHPNVELINLTVEAELLDIPKKDSDGITCIAIS